MTEIWLDEIYKDSRYGLKGKLLINKKSAFQEISIIQTTEHGNALMLDGCWMTSDKDEKYYHECLVHPALSSLQNISRVLIIGGGDGGTARECLKYQGLSTIDLVEIDKEVIEISKIYLPQLGKKVWDDQRVKIHISEGFEWVKNIKDNYYDAILIDCSDPSEFANTLFSLKFYIECKRIMKADGIFATQSESPEAFKSIHLKIYKSLNTVFKKVSTMYSYVPFYPSGVWSWSFAKKNNDEVLKSRYHKIDIIEKSCDIWNLNFQEGALKMIPSKILRELKDYK